MASIFFPRSQDTDGPLFDSRGGDGYTPHFVVLVPGSVPGVVPIVPIRGTRSRRWAQH